MKFLFAQSTLGFCTPLQTLPFQLGGGLHHRRPTHQADPAQKQPSNCDRTVQNQLANYPRQITEHQILVLRTNAFLLMRLVH